MSLWSKPNSKIIWKNKKKGDGGPYFDYENEIWSWERSFTDKIYRPSRTAPISYQFTIPTLMLNQWGPLKSHLPAHSTRPHIKALIAPHKWQEPKLWLKKIPTLTHLKNILVKQRPTYKEEKKEKEKEEVEEEEKRRQRWEGPSAASPR